MSKRKFKVGDIIKVWSFHRVIEVYDDGSYDMIDKFGNLINYHPEREYSSIRKVKNLPKDERIV